MLSFLSVLLAAAVPAVPPAATAFPMCDVHLLGGPLKQSQDLAAEYLLHLEPDRLLARYRTEAGLEKKADNYPGWENKELPGVALGFYLSGCARLFATLDDQRFLDRITYCMDELDACQQANGDGFLLATRDAKKHLEEIAAGDIRLGGGWILNGEPEPYYAMEKLFSGLRDAYRYAGNEKALLIERRLGDWLDKHLACLDDAQLDAVMKVEYGGMNWVLSDLYADTGDAKYLALSRRWHDKSIEDPLAAGQDCLPGKHANTQFPKICGLAARYPYTGDPADRIVPEFFWDRVVHHHSYVTGGDSLAEHFGPPDQLSDRLGPNTTELCNSYNMIRLTELLFAIAPKPEYAEFAERVLFNHILAAQHPADGRICYFLPLLDGVPRTYESLYNDFKCCTCSGLDSYAKHCDFLYMHNEDTLFVNLFAESEVTWREKGVRIVQHTNFPDEDRTRFTFFCDQPVEFTFAPRCPAWCDAGTTITIDSQATGVSARPGSYAALHRTWQNGTWVELRFPMSLRIEAMPDNARKVAFFHGPILLAAPAQPLDPDAEDGEIAQALVDNGRPLTEALTPVDNQPLTYTLTGIARPRDFQLQPLFRLHDQPYIVYWDVLTEEAWTASQQAQTKRNEQDAHTLDRARPGNPASETAHAFTGENTHTGYGAYGQHPRTQWRDASDGGWFRYTVAVSSSQPNTLECTYWGRELGARTFDILVDGNVIATDTLDNNHPETFYCVEHPIPPALTKDKATIEITFQAHPGNTAGGLFGLRVIQ